MIKRVFCCGIFLLSLYSTSAISKNTSSTDPLLEQVYSLTGLEQQFYYLSKTFTDSGIEMGRSNLPPEQLTQRKVNQIMSGLNHQYAVDSLKTKAMTILKQELGQKLLENVLPLMQAPAWRNAIKLENKAYDLARINELEDYIGGKLQENPPRTMRVDLAYELAEKTGAVDLTINLITSAALNNARLLVGDENHELPANIEANIRATMADMRQEYESLVIRQYLYTYRYLSDRQLEEYVSCYDNPSIQALNSAMTIALMEAFK
ncbi:hypothetical protein M3P05_10735 [Sansalvadorimonas sp. 2012CJ34-2]|uniref:DUF2059 domain-containing protein n=1 Tax=Parendozoicomonas callyspongiae TaxID=2942213 RepID=A0ABT0PG87_9GAMM|nr:hypothetical protein [Sansalvadorimonas sp. 2012CJ34-2]MCL6270395.1 hypothetical protein [Sansalvadorimonas sp. 2012CJ34-2]